MPSVSALPQHPSVLPVTFAWEFPQSPPSPTNSLYTTFDHHDDDTPTLSLNNNNNNSDYNNNKSFTYGSLPKSSIPPRTKSAPAYVHKVQMHKHYQHQEQINAHMRQDYYNTEMEQQEREKPSMARNTPGRHTLGRRNTERSGATTLGRRNIERSNNPISQASYRLVESIYQTFFNPSESGAGEVRAGYASATTYYEMTSHATPPPLPRASAPVPRSTRKNTRQPTPIPPPRDYDYHHHQHQQELEMMAFDHSTSPDREGMLWFRANDTSPWLRAWCVVRHQHVFVHSPVQDMAIIAQVPLSPGVVLLPAEDFPRARIPAGSTRLTARGADQYAFTTTAPGECCPFFFAADSRLDMMLWMAQLIRTAQGFAAVPRTLIPIQRAYSLCLNPTDPPPKSSSKRGIAISAPLRCLHKQPSAPDLTQHSTSSTWPKSMSSAYHTTSPHAPKRFNLQKLTRKLMGFRENSRTKPA
ncbi:hypothetical protein DFJ77DRAFT_211407 [Powellomyces hirtus]|nr:hypothetical protein DFJ77DRAFT_211407 [Powellomyces hirtus]